MQIGARRWRFHLLTAQAHPGALLFCFHSARPHCRVDAAADAHTVPPGARHRGCAVLLIVCALSARHRPMKRRIAFCCYSHPAWAGCPVQSLGISDLVIPESNVLQSPHQPAFSAATARGVVIMMCAVRSLRLATSNLRITTMLASLALAIVQPFAVAPLYDSRLLALVLAKRWSYRRSCWTAVMLAQ
jgi:hypothetical protein